MPDGSVLDVTSCKVLYKQASKQAQASRPKKLSHSTWDKNKDKSKNKAAPQPLLDNHLVFATV